MSDTNVLLSTSTASVPPLRRNWRFQLLWLGAGLSNLGDATVNLALPLLILFITGSPALAGIAAATSLALALLFGIPAGVWVDRTDRRRVLLLAETALALIWGAFAVLVYLDAVAIWNILLVAALAGSATAFSGPAHATAIQALVPKPQLASAYAQGQARAYAIQLAGPPLGGLLYAVSRAAPFAFQLVVSAISVLCYTVAKVPRRPVDDSRDDRPTGTPVVARSMKQDLREALSWLLGQRGLRAVVGMAFFVNPIVNAIWIPIIVLVTAHGGGSVDVGLIMAGVGVGGLVGSLLSARLSTLVPAGKLILSVGLIMGLSYCLMPLPWGVYWPVVPIILSCVAAPALNVALMALIGALVPSSMMGRMSALIRLTFHAFTPLGPAIGGILAASLGGGGALVVCGVSLLVVTAVASASPALRRLRATDEGATANDRET